MSNKVKVCIGYVVGGEPLNLPDGEYELLASGPLVKPKPKCSVCKDTGTYCIGTSGLAEDGNAPLLERCDCDAAYPADAPELPPGQQDALAAHEEYSMQHFVEKLGQPATPPVVQQGELSKRLREHDDPRLYREADILMHEAANELDRVATSAGQEKPADPMDWPLPCDIKVGAGTIKKGCKLSVLVARMHVMHDMIREGWSSATPSPAVDADNVRR